MMACACAHAEEGVRVAHRALMHEEEVERAAIAKVCRHVAEVGDVRRRRLERRWQSRLTGCQGALTRHLDERRLLLLRVGTSFWIPIDLRGIAPVFVAEQHDDPFGRTKT